MSGCLEGAPRNRFQIRLMAARLAPPERAACSLMAIAYRGGAIAIFAALIDAIFDVAAPGWAQQRREAFKGNFALLRLEIEDEGGAPIAFYLLSNPWIDDLAGALRPDGSIPDDCSALRDFP